MRIPFPFRRRPYSQRGQSLVETALVLPIFLWLIFGLIDGGRLVYSNSAVSQAAREGARVAAAEAAWVGITTSIDPSCVNTLADIGASNPGAHVCPPSIASLKNDVRRAVNRMDVTMGTITAVYLDCEPPTGTAPTGNWTSGNDCAGPTGGAIASKGWHVSVRVEYVYNSITPVISAVPALKTATLSGAATMTVD